MLNSVIFFLHFVLFSKSVVFSCLMNTFSKIRSNTKISLKNQFIALKYDSYRWKNDWILRVELIGRCSHSNRK